MLHQAVADRAGEVAGGGALRAYLADKWKEERAVGTDDETVVESRPFEDHVA